MKIRWWPKPHKYIWREGRWGFKIGRLYIWFGEPEWKQLAEKGGYWISKQRTK